MSYPDHLDEWECWTGILNEEQARQLVETWANRSEKPQPRKREDTMGSKSLFVLTFPATATVLVEASSEKEAIADGTKKAEAGLNAPGILRIVGDAKVTAVAGGKPEKSKSKAKAEDDDDEEDDETEDDEDSDDEDEDDDEDEEESDDEDDDDEEDDEDEDDDDEDEEPSKKTKVKEGKKDKKSDKPTGKIKIKLKKS